jgi:hypothetical protein
VADTATAAYPGLVLGVARFFYDPRGSMRAVLNSYPNEGRLLTYALVAAGIIIAGRIAMILGFIPPEADRMGMITAEVAGIVVFPLAYYAVSALGTLIARGFGGQGSWRDGRAAFFWAALVSAPVVVLSSLLPRMLSGIPFEVLTAIGQIGGVFFAWALAQCYAEAFGFRRAWLVFATICAMIFGLILLLWGLQNP